MLTLANYIPVAKALLQQIVADEPTEDQISIVSLGLYNAYCDGMQVANAQREIENRLANRRKRQSSENEEFLKVFQERPRE